MKSSHCANRAAFSFLIVGRILLWSAFLFTANIQLCASAVITSVSPVRQVLTPGQNLQLSVTASGTGTLTYQWIHNGQAVAGATNSSYVRAGVSTADGGWYAVKVSDESGIRIGAPFFVTVAPALTQVRVWGSHTNYGEGDIPAGLNSVISISTGSNSVLALKSDGTVAAWGMNNYGQTIVPSNLSNVVAVAAGRAHSLALKSDGTMVAWGLSNAGQASVPAGLTDVVAIAAGGQHSLVLRSDGTVVGMGYSYLAIPADLTNVVAIAGGVFFSLALKSDGTVVGWGDNSSGQLTIPANLNGVTAIAAGGYHALALKDDGTVVAWGEGAGSVPTGLSDVASIAAGISYSIAVKADGTIVVWGTEGALSVIGFPPEGLTSVVASGIGSTFALVLRDATLDTVPIVTTQPVAPVVSEGQSASFTVAATGAGPITYQWRKDGTAISGATSATLTLTRIAMSASGSYDVVVTNFLGSSTSIAAILTVKAAPFVALASPARQVLQPGQNLTLAVTATGSGPLSYQWFHNGFPVSGATGASFARPNLAWADGGWYVVLVTDDNGPQRSKPMFVQVAPAVSRVVGWGDSAYGKDFPPDNLISPLAVAAGGDHSIAINGDGKVVVWGLNPFIAPVPANLTDVVAVAAGDTHVMALRSDGTVCNWGFINDIPAGLTDVVSIAAGGHFSTAVRSDGTVLAWTSDASLYPIPAGLTNVTSAAAGWSHFLALKDDGTVVTWGTDDSGSPVAPVGLTNVSAIAAGSFHSLALKSDGTVVAWGRNDVGQATVPIGLSTVVAISAGGDLSMALKADGTVVAWGRNNLGQATPSIWATGVFAISGVRAHALVLRDAAGEGVPTFITQPVAAQTVIAGQGASWTVSVTGGGPYRYQWRRNAINILGATDSSYTIANVAAGDAGTYTVVAVNSLGSATSSGGTLVLGSAALITTQPASQTVYMGDSVTFTTTASGNPIPTYQWRKNGVNISDATGASYTIAKSLAGDVGIYSAVATNSFGSITSEQASLSFNTSGGGTVPAGFDVSHYLALYPDVAAAFGSDLYGAWLYYRNFGIYQGEIFDDEYRVEEYLALYPELAALFGNDLSSALVHWLTIGRIEGKLGRIPLEFKAQGYFDRNPDVAAAVGNDPILAWGHYWLYGIYEGRAYDDELRVFEYLAINADLTAAFVDDWRTAALHWMRYGRTEGRLGRIPLIFNATEYLVRNPDVAATWGTNPTTVFLHFWLYGVNESRTFDDLFRVDEYLVLNPDLLAVFGTDRRGAFKHWVRYGQTEGRLGRNP